MSLAALIRGKKGPGNLATAIPAISAIQGGATGGIAARIATVAVANPEGRQTTTYHRWLVTLPDGEALEVDALPPATLPEVLAAYPPGTLAEPLCGGELTLTPPPAAGPTPPRLVRCGTCTRFERLPRLPRLGHCQAGEPEAPCGLWDTDRRACGEYEEMETPSGGTAAAKKARPARLAVGSISP